MLVTDYGKHKEMDRWMECDRVSMCGQDSRRGEVRRLAMLVIVNHLLMRPPVISRGLGWRSRRRCRYVASRSENTREDSGCTREELRGRESARMDLAEHGGKQMIGQLTQLSGSGWK